MACPGVKADHVHIVPGFLAIVVAAASAGGCGNTGLSNGPQVYVNLQKLAQARPEWSGVDELSGQINAINSAAQSRVPAGSVPSNGPSLRLPAPSVISAPDLSRANRGMVDVSSLLPGPDAIRRELENEARGELALDARSRGRRYQYLWDQEKLNWDNIYAAQRRHILLRYEGPVTALELKEGVLLKWLDEFKSAAHGGKPSRRLYDQVKARLTVVRRSLSDWLTRQNTELRANEAARVARITEIDQKYRDLLAAKIREEHQKIEAEIETHIASAAKDAAEEQAQRQQLFGNSFSNPLQRALPMNTPQGPTVIMSAGAMKGSSPAFNAALDQRKAILLKQRSVLAQMLIKDTRDWLDAVAKEQNLVVTLTQEPGESDATGQFAVWLRKKIHLPPETQQRMTKT